jgi:GTPase involved in cell partitioning and DNA repair
MPEMKDNLSTLVREMKPYFKEIDDNALLAVISEMNLLPTEEAQKLKTEAYSCLNSRSSCAKYGIPYYGNITSLHENVVKIKLYIEQKKSKQQQNYRQAQEATSA